MKQRDAERTKKRILDVAQKLFLEKGYDNTSISDIVKELGMTKGAIYHHFKSKYAILDTLVNYNSEIDKKPIANILKLNKIKGNGLEKLKGMIKISLKSYNVQSIVYSAAVTLKSPRFIGEQYLSNLEVSSEIKEIIEAGIEDGSIKTKYPEEVAEIFLMYMNLRIGIHLDKLSKEDYMRKLYFLRDMFNCFEVPIFDKEILDEAEKLYDYLHRKK